MPGDAAPASLLANFAGSFSNLALHLPQQNATRLSSCRTKNFGSTSAPLTGHFALTGLLRCYQL